MKPAACILLVFVSSCVSSDFPQGNTCNVADPIEDLRWLKAETAELNDSEMGRSFWFITQASHKFKTVFIVKHCCPNCLTTPPPVYSCNGQLLFDGSDKEYKDIRNERIIWKAAEYDVGEIIEQGRIGNLADNYDVDLNTHPHRRFANMAGVSLRITTNDMAKFLTAYFQDNAVLNRESIAAMLTPAPGTDSMWTLGNEVYASNGAGGWLIGHGGGAFPRTGASIRINPATQNAIAIMMTGGSEMIDPYMTDWTYWETGEILFDIRNIIHNRGVVFGIAAALGTIVILMFRRGSAGRVRHRKSLQRS